MSNPTKFTWVDPTLNTDGSAIAAGEITGYMLGVRDTAAAGSVAGTYPLTASAPAGSTTALLSLFTPPLPTGSYAGAVQAVTAKSASAWSSPEATFTIVEIPNAPTGFSVG